MTGGPDQVTPMLAQAAPRLTLMVNTGPGAERAIPCRRVVTLIGSRPGCKINLQHRSVDPVHTVIVNDGSRIIAVDMVTEAGTLLNGLQMEHEPLDDGDVLTVRSWEFRVVMREPELTGRGDAHPFELDPSPHVVALEDIASGRVLRPRREVCVIGRRNGCDIAISDHRVSRVHALLLRYFGHPVIFDLLSSNKTLVNDQAVQFRRLRNDDVIVIGDGRFRVHLRGSVVGEMAGRNGASGNGKTGQSPRDMVDIHATESNNHWRIADHLEKTTRKG